jgi:hypothetical protein
MIASMLQGAEFTNASAFNQFKKKLHLATREQE